ncbi:MAG: polyphosphate polymerase domain-containing protein [Oscillospiraceae bacterium]|nr:polyphosphate polymerase domain-containing protein [Oscillospiraceae bacterium]
MAISVMQRYEMKYLLNPWQTDLFRRRLEGRMRLDGYGLTSIASLYYDTPSFRLIRASLDAQEYKEKIRLRSYGPATEQTPVFLELKRKYEGVVYKRRVQSTVPDVSRFFAGIDTLGSGQIQKELACFRDHYRPLVPVCLVVYDREAYFEPGGDLRLTIDRCPRYRMEDLTLTGSLDGKPLLDDGWSILEIKVQGALPLWLSSILSAGEIFKSSFSKYGEAYRREMIRTQPKTIVCAGPELPGAA